MSRNSHDYARFAGAYSKLGIENTYYLAFRDLPALISKYCHGQKALDHGCGPGRSSRFLKELGFSVTSIDISQDMLNIAREKDPLGDYQLLQGMDLPFPFADSSFDLVFQCCVAIEIPSRSAMDKIFLQISRVLKDSGIAVVVTGNAEQRLGEWSSFIFPQHTPRVSGEQVELLIRGTDIALYDYVWFHSDFEESFRQAGLIIEERHQPMATGSEPYQWYQELTKPFWDVYLLRKE